MLGWLYWTPAAQKMVGEERVKGGEKRERETFCCLSGHQRAPGPSTREIRSLRDHQGHHGLALRLRPTGKGSGEGAGSNREQPS
jgi:hypothetical protein